MTDVAMCLELLPAALQGLWKPIDDGVPALWRIAAHATVDWPKWQGGWVKQGCFLSNAQYEGETFWMLSSALN